METRGGGGISGGGGAAGAGGGGGDAGDLSKSGGALNIPGGGARGSSTGGGGGGSSGGSAITAQRVSGYGILAAIGFFSLAAQTLLFRDFFTVFEQSELGVACFFCAWLLWTAAGAFVARARWSRLAASVDALSLLILLFVPAFLLQRMGIRGARAIAGVEAYEFFPLLRMAGIALLVNSPVSFLSGFFYTRACHAFSAAESIAPARVFIVEALGSFAGGIAVTLLLAGGAAEERIFLLTAGLLAGATALHRLRRGSLASGLVPLLAALLALGLGADRIWTERRDLEDWSRFLPAEALAGRFTTSQARYLFGEHRGQFHVVAGESIADAIPREENASRIISIHLAQNPQARRFLVIGPAGFSIALRLLDLPQAEVVAWLHPDPEYPARLRDALPPAYRGGFDRIEAPGVDAREFLRREGLRFDIAILDIPPVTTLSLNRYWTREFFALVRKSLSGSGIAGVRVSAGENYMGEEVVNVGASVYRTLESVFEHIVIQPGDESWLIASDGGQLSGEPAALRDRFRAVDGAERIYPSDALLSLYLPDRMEKQRERYREAIAGDSSGFLLNTDGHPRALLHGLLLAAKQTDASASRLGAIRALARRGMALILGGLAIYAILRLGAGWRGGRGRRRGRDDGRERRNAAGALEPLDAIVLVASTGMAGMALSILLMFEYQSAFGSLFLHAGMLSALFMLGLAAGSIASERLLIARPRGAAWLLLGALGLEISLLGLLALAELDPPAAGFALLMLAGGLLSGAYVPAAAAELKRAGLADRSAGGWIALGDNLGGSLGGLLVGLGLLPLFGSRATLGALAAIVAINLPALLLAGLRRRPSRRREEHEEDRWTRLVRPAAPAMLGIALFLLFASHLLHSIDAESAEERLLAAAHRMAPEAAIEARSGRLRSGVDITYLVETDAQGAVQGYMFETEQLAPGAVGYGGPISLAVRAGARGELLGVEILRSRETPAYLESEGLAEWRRDLVSREERSLFRPRPLEGVDACTGATITAEAMLHALRISGPRFASEILEIPIEDAPAVDAVRSTETPLRHIAFALLLAGALVLRWLPSRWARRAFLLAVLVGAGWWLNLQFSLAQVLSLLALEIPPLGWSVALLLAAALPLVVLLLGNIYCGYLCPLGALQELVGDLRPPSWRTAPGRTAWRAGRSVKYALLFLLVSLFALRLDTSIASVDPLVTAFSGERTPLAIALLAAIIALAFAFPRFWCRAICPAGAFLALLRRVQILRFLLPRPRVRACPYGVTGARDLDCIACDRCRIAPAAGDESMIRVPLPGPAVPARRGWSALFLGAAALLALAIAAAAVLEQRERAGLAGRGPEGRAAVVPGAAGRPRDADLERLRSLIRQGRLSAREALHYKPVEEEKTPNEPDGGDDG